MVSFARSYVVSRLSETIRKTTAGKPEGEVFSSADFERLGNRAAASRALAALAKKGELLRLERGLYVAPVQGRFGRRSPAPAKVLASLAAKTGERLFPSGAAEANAFGLDTQVPIREVYLTSGRSRCLFLGQLKVQLMRAPSALLQPGIEGRLHRIRASLAHQPEALARLDALVKAPGRLAQEGARLLRD